MESFPLKSTSTSFSIFHCTVELTGSVCGEFGPCITCQRQVCKGRSNLYYTNLNLKKDWYAHYPLMTMNASRSHLWILEVLREFRFLAAAPSTCSWKFIALVVVYWHSVGTGVVGACAAAAILSNQCRRLGVSIARTVLHCLVPSQHPQFGPARPAAGD